MNIEHVDNRVRADSGKDKAGKLLTRAFNALSKKPFAGADTLNTVVILFPVNLIQKGGKDGEETKEPLARRIIRTAKAVFAVPKSRIGEFFEAVGEIASAVVESGWNAAAIAGGTAGGVAGIVAGIAIGMLTGNGVATFVAAVAGMVGGAAIGAFGVPFAIYGVSWIATAALGILPSYATEVVRNIRRLLAKKTETAEQPGSA